MYDFLLANTFKFPLKLGLIWIYYIYNNKNICIYLN